MNRCRHCSNEAEWRYKEGWGVLACASWFAGRCDGPPLHVTPPVFGDVRQNDSNWAQTRLRELWPLGKKDSVSSTKPVQELGEWAGPFEPPEGWLPWLN